MTDARGAPPSDTIATTEVRRRATVGAALLAGRGMAIQGLAFAGGVVLARLLAPEDFGLVALGTAVMYFGSLMANYGLGAALIRRPEPPERADLAAVVGFQIVLTSVLAVLTACSAALFGDAGLLAAVMVASLPITSFRSPGAIVLERRLSYRPLVMVEILENVVYYAWAVGAVALGMGVWGLATAVVVRSLSGTAAMTVVSPVGLVRPILAWDRIRTILGFGARLQGIAIANFVRDHGYNVGIAAIAGVATLGLWALAYRVLQIPYLLFKSLWQVSFPAMAKLIAAGEDARPIMERGVGMAAVATGVLLTPLVGAGPDLVPTVFGDKWDEAAYILPFACLGYMVAGPISVAVGGYLLAMGDAAAVLRGAIRHTIAQFVVAFPLLPLLDVWALGLGVLASSVVEAVVLTRATYRHTTVRLLGPMARPVLAAVAAGGGGWLLGASLDEAVWTPVACGAAALAAYLAILWVVHRSTLRATVGIVAGAVRAGRAKEAQAGRGGQLKEPEAVAS